jgi:Ca2+-binding RTX toxin-like protein
MVPGGHSGGAWLGSAQNVTGTRKADVLLGDSAPNRLTGGRGDDIIKGGEGDDQLLGDKGGDALDGGPGENTNDGGQGADTCLNPSQGAHVVNCEPTRRAAAKGRGYDPNPTGGCGGGRGDAESALGS